MSCSFALYPWYLAITAIYEGLGNSYSQNRLINCLLSVCGKCRLYNKGSFMKCSAFPNFSHFEKEMALHICVKYLCSERLLVIFCVRSGSFPFLFSVRYFQFSLQRRSVQCLVPLNYPASQWLRQHALFGLWLQADGDWQGAS